MVFVNAALRISGSGPTASKDSNLVLTFNDVVQVVGGFGGFSGVVDDVDVPSVLIAFKPGTLGNEISFGGSFTLIWGFGFLDVTGGTTIEGTIVSEPPLPFDVEFALMEKDNPPTYTLPANATSGSFSFPFDPSADMDLPSIKSLIAQARG
jgi:hypothetical protein